jgi:uncharacterized membrane protein
VVLRESVLPAWCIPLGYAFAAFAIGVFLPRIETRFIPEWTAGISSAAAIAIYSSIAAGTITLTGIVFSLVFVMGQFTATAYSPRLVLWMSRDPLVFHAIGVFTATFLYAVSALAWVDRQSSGTVPFFSGWLAVVLLLASVCVFVGLVHGLSRLQVHSVLAFTGNFARRIIDVMYPPLEKSGSVASDIASIPSPLTQTVVYHGPPQSIQSLDVTVLAALAERTQGVIEVVSAVGDTLIESTPLLRVYGGQEAIGEREVRKAIRTGLQRTFEQDPKYSIQLLRDIAIRALSPAINDPTTAVQALDQIEDLLLRLGRRRLDIGEVRDKSGRLRVIVQVPTWDDFLDLAFSEICSYGAESKQVMRRMRAVLGDLLIALPEERHSALRRQLKRLDSTIARVFPDVEDKREASAEDREGLGLTRKRQIDGSDVASALPVP